MFYFFPVLFCFALPFGSQILSIIVALWFLTSLLNIELAFLNKGIRTKSFIVMQLFFILTCVSAAFSENHAEAITAIEIKLSFLFLPFLFFCFNWPIPVLKRVLVSFVSGCFFACCCLLIRAILLAFQGHIEYFFYSDFSGFIHPSYFALYLTFAIVIVLIFYQHWFSSQKLILRSAYAFVAIFILCILLCSSKLGLIGLAICSFLLAYYKFKNVLTIKRLLVFTIGMVIFLSSVYLIFPKPFQRLSSLYEFSNSDIDKTTVESTRVRALIWKESLNLIESNFLIGTGVADANDELYRVYEKEGMTGAFEHKLNAHNQYFQTFIGMGFIGFILLLLLTVLPLFFSMLKQHFYELLFWVLIVLNFFVESMLQTAAGVLFFAFFYCFITNTDERLLINEDN